MGYIKIKLSGEQKKQLNNTEKAVTKPQLLKRIQCVKLKDMGWTNLKIAEFLNVCNDTITDWLKAYSEKGIDGLLSWGYKGRQSFLTDEQLDIIRQRNIEKPFDNASEAVEFIETQFGIRYNLSWVQKLLKKKLGLSYKKTKLIPGNTQPIEVQETFVNEYEKLKETAENKEIHLLFFDPTHQVHNTVNGTCWQTRGKNGTIIISSNTGRKRISVLGAINSITGDCTTIITENNCDKDMVIATFQEIRKDYPDNKEIVIILDNASYNHAYKTVEEAEFLNIRLVFLPTYSPNLNLIERLWKLMKKIILKNKYYKTFKEFKMAIEDFFENIDIHKQAIMNIMNHKFEILKAD